MRHEAELKSNAYWLNLLAHLQASSVPRKVRLTCLHALKTMKSKKNLTWTCSDGGCCDYQELSCIKELTSLYEAASIEDIYVAYNQLKVDEDSLYSCIGIAGAQAGEDVTGKYDIS